ncbi:MAG: ABC transporter permease, partial [Longimicrobiales bacterium]
VTCAGLLGRSLQKLEAQDFGFQIDGRYTVNLAPSFTMIPADRMESTYARLRERLRRIPGVVNAACSLYAPMSGDNWATLITVDGRSPAERLQASWNRVSPDYFETIGTPVVRGRALDERDGPGAPLVTVVSQRFATRFFGDTDPIGRRIGLRRSSGEVTRDFEIVGVVGDVKYQDGRAAPYVTFFLPFLQQTAAARRANEASGIRLDRSHYAQAIELHTSGPVPGLEREVRRALADVDRRLTVMTLVPMDEQIARAFNLDRLIARIAVIFGATALLLACLGLYGVTAYSVTRRTREIGIRMALGASRARVLQRVVRSALVQAAFGIALGLPAAIAVGQLLRAQLFGISALDPLVMTGALAVLGLCALVAACIPAYR